MVLFAQTIILGLLVGSLYALLASGLTLIFGVMRVINIAHGAFAILAAFCAWTLWDRFGLDPIAAIPILTVVFFGLGWITYQTTVRFARGSHVTMTVLVTFGIALLLEGLMGFIWGNTSHSIRTSYSVSSVQLGPIYIPRVYVLAALVAAVVLGILWLILNRTWFGRAIRAASVNEPAALLTGVSTKRISALTFAIGIAALGAGGAAIAAIYPFVPGSHYQWIARLLAIVVLGGLGSLPGAIIGAGIIGLAENLATTYIGAAWPVAVPFVVIFVVLLIRPQGLMGTRLREDAVA